jgi:hypothetical protein
MTHPAPHFATATSVSPWCVVLVNKQTLCLQCAFGTRAGLPRHPRHCVCRASWHAHAVASAPLRLALRARPRALHCAASVLGQAALMARSLEEVDLRNGNAARNGHRSLYADEGEGGAAPPPRRAGFSIAASGRDPQPLADGFASRSDAPEWTSASGGAAPSKLDLPRRASRPACSGAQAPLEAQVGCHQPPRGSRAHDRLAASGCARTRTCPAGPAWRARRRARSPCVPRTEGCVRAGAWQSGRIDCLSTPRRRRDKGCSGGRFCAAVVAVALILALATGLGVGIARHNAARAAAAAQAAQFNDASGLARPPALPPVAAGGIGGGQHAGGALAGSPAAGPAAPGPAASTNATAGSAGAAPAPSTVYISGFAPGPAAAMVGAAAGAAGSAAGAAGAAAAPSTGYISGSALGAGVDAACNFSGTRSGPRRKPSTASSGRAP